MEAHECADVDIRLCNVSDISTDPKGPIIGGLQFYNGRAYHQTEKRTTFESPASLTSLDSEEANKCLQQILFEMDLTDEKPWRQDRLSDFFNYDLNERAFREWIRSQIRLRFEMRSLSKLGSASSSGGGYLGQRSGGGRSGPYSGGGGYGGGGGGGYHQIGQKGGSVALSSPPIGKPVEGVKGAGKSYYGGGGGGDYGVGKRDCKECESLYVVGFPLLWTKDDLQQFFSQWGIVMNMHVIPISQEGQRAAGIVNYITSAMAKEAITNANGRILEGSDTPLEVKFKLPGRRDRKG